MTTPTSSAPLNKRKYSPGPQSNGLIIKGGRVRLPDKLMSYLNAEIAPESLYWNDGGDTFSINTSLVQAEVLNKCFKGMKLSSFTRSLNRWGFKRTFRAQDTKNIQTYQHPRFRRSCPEGVSDMTMVSTTAATERQQPSTSTTITTTSMSSEETSAAQETRSEESSCFEVPTELQITAKGGSVSSMDGSQSSPEPQRKKFRHSVDNKKEEEANLLMIHRLKEMGTKLQVAMEESNKRQNKELELAAQTARKEKEEQDQQHIIAIQALIANQRAMNLQSGLGLNAQMGLYRIVQSSTAGNSSTAHRSLPPTNNHSPSASYLAASILNIMANNVQQNAGRKN